MKPFVCVFYCKSDSGTNKARDVYRSILFQILTRMKQLKSTLTKWYEEAKIKNSLIDPTRDNNALLAETQIDSEFQSIVEAAMFGQADVIRYLLTQDHVDIGPHLYYRANSKKGSGRLSGRNVLHCAATRGNADTLRVLVEKFPGDINELTDSGDTPLRLLVFTGSTDAEAVRVLIEDGMADVNLSPDGEYFSPLRTAIRAKSLEVCQVLSAHGAHVDDAINFNHPSGRLVLEDELDDVETSERILKVLALASNSETCRKHLNLRE
jgi:hypothetical protein